MNINSLLFIQNELLVHKNAKSATSFQITLSGGWPPLCRPTPASRLHAAILMIFLSDLFVNAAFDHCSDEAQNLVWECQYLVEWAAGRLLHTLAFAAGST